MYLSECCYKLLRWVQQASEQLVVWGLSPLCCPTGWDTTDSWSQERTAEAGGVIVF